MWKVPLFELNYDSEEEQAVLDVLHGGWITMGQKTAELERRFNAFLGIRSGSVAVSSGTAAFHVALMALDIRRGDEVVVPALTFVSNLNVVERMGARPVLADCTSLDDWTVNPVAVEAAISSRTRAIVALHFAGYSCAMDEIMALARRHGVDVIEDAAHAPGSTHGNASLGVIGDVGCFSFFSNKNIATGEGGMFVSTREELEARARLLRSHGMSSMTLDRHEGRSSSYDVLCAGLNYRIDELRAALGVVQLCKLAAGNERRRSAVRRYRDSLSGLTGLEIPFVSWNRGTSSHHIFPVLLDPAIDRKQVVALLREQGIQSSIHYPAPEHFTAYRDGGLGPAPVASEISRRCLTLPLFPTMTAEQVDLVCEALEEAVTGANRVAL